MNNVLQGAVICCTFKVEDYFQSGLVFARWCYWYLVCRTDAALALSCCQLLGGTLLIRHPPGANQADKHSISPELFGILPKHTIRN